MDSERPVRPVEAPFFVGPHYVCPMRNRIGTGPDAVTVAPLTMRLLSVLASAPGETFTRDALLDAVWDGLSVTPASVDRAVCDLRKALGDDARAPRLIETVRKRGVRLMVAVIPAPPRPVPGWGAPHRSHRP